jgi:hypothetical protein
VKTKRGRGVEFAAAERREKREVAKRCRGLSPELRKAYRLRVKNLGRKAADAWLDARTGGEE